MIVRISVRASITGWKESSGQVFRLDSVQGGNDPMRVGELRRRVGGRNRKHAHAGLQRRLNPGAGIFYHHTFA